MTEGPTAGGIGAHALLVAHGTSGDGMDDGDAAAIGTRWLVVVAV